MIIPFFRTSLKHIALYYRVVCSLTLHLKNIAKHGTYFFALIISLGMSSTAAASDIDKVIIDCYDSKVGKAGTRNDVQVEYYDKNGKIFAWKTEWQGSMPGRNTERKTRYPQCDNVYDAFAGMVTSERADISSVQLRATSGDALWIDELFLAKGWDRKHTFGRDGGKGWCLSTQASDANGKWRKYVDGPCEPCLEFRTSNNSVYNCSKPNPNPGFKQLSGTYHDYDSRIARALAASKAHMSKFAADLSKGKTAYQSSTGYGGVASRAIDGNTNQNYSAKSTSHTASGDKMPWWEVDLGAVYVVTDIKIYNRTDCCGERLRGAKIIFSQEALPKNAPVSMQAMAQMMGMQRQPGRPVTIVNASAQPYQYISIAAERHKLGGKGSPLAVARYIRIQLPAPGYLHLSEVKVTGRRDPIR